MRFRKKIAAISIVATGTLVAGTAFAWWTSSGSGSNLSAATVGSAAALDVLDVTVAGGSHPGDGPAGVAVAGTIKNSTSSSIKVSGIAGDGVALVSFDSGHLGCSASWFSFSGSLTGGPTILARNDSVAFTGRLVMSESGSDQDACQGASMTLHLKAS